jgi:hypothetical protein
MDFVIVSRVEQPAPRQFLAVASAVLAGVSQRCGPEQRSQVCTSRNLAELASFDLASKLATAVVARGDTVVEMVLAPMHVANELATLRDD